MPEYHVSRPRFSREVVRRDRRLLGRPCLSEYDSYLAVAVRDVSFPPRSSGGGFPKPFRHEAILYRPVDQSLLCRSLAETVP